MGKIVIWGLLVLNVLFADAQSPVFKWAEAINPSDIIGSTYSNSITVDGSGNIFTTGYFSGTVDFDPGPDTLNLTSGDFDIFISKLDPSGNLLWVKTLGTTGTLGYDVGNAITVDVDGNVFVTGSFSDTIDFDPGLGVSVEIARGIQDIFLLKLNSLGEFQWVKTMNGRYRNEGLALTLDTFKNIYLTGYFSDTIDFDPGPSVFILYSHNSDAFVCKMDSLGSLLWAKNMGGDTTCIPFSIVVDPQGNVYTAGGFRGTVDFDPGLNAFNITSAGGTDIFLSKLDKNGEFTWAKSFGGIGDDAARTIALDREGNIIITGTFHNVVDFDSSQSTATLAVNGTVNATDIFISKLDSVGKVIWAHRAGGIEDDGVGGMALDSMGNIYLTGWYRNTLRFNQTNVNYDLNAIDGSDAFFVRYSPSGNVQWSVSAGGQQNDNGNAIAIDGSGNIFTTGTYQNVVDFDPGSGVYDLNSPNGSGIFIQKYGQIATAIKESNPTVSITIYPNPTNGQFNLVIPKSTTDTRIEIYNTLGALISQQTTTSETNVIDLTRQANGLYFVRVINGNELVASQKIVKQ